MPAVRAEGRSTRNAVTSLSKRVQSTTAARTPSGCVLHVRNSLTTTKICLEKSREAQETAARLQSKSLIFKFFKSNSFPLT
jgi:hypothetical protein